MRTVEETKRNRNARKGKFLQTLNYSELAN